MKKALIAAVAALALAAHAGGSFMSAGDLLNKLQAKPGTTDRNIGIGYVVAVADMGEDINHCIPGDVSAGYMAQTVSILMKRNSLPLDELSATGPVLEAMKAAWPCKSAQSQKGKVSL